MPEGPEPSAGAALGGLARSGKPAAGTAGSANLGPAGSALSRPAGSATVAAETAAVAAATAAAEAGPWPPELQAKTCLAAITGNN